MNEGRYTVLAPGFEEAPYSNERPSALALDTSRPPPHRSGVVPRMPTEDETEPLSRPPSSHRGVADRGARDDLDPLLDMPPVPPMPTEDELDPFVEPPRRPAASSSPDAEPLPLVNPKSAIAGARFARTRTRAYVHTLPFLKAADEVPSSVPAPDVIELPSSPPPSAGHETPRAFPVRMIERVAPEPSTLESRQPRVAAARPVVASRSSSRLLAVAVAVVVASAAIVAAVEIVAHFS